MAFNGSGVFNRLYNWVNDRNNGINILASRMDAEMDGMATGLTDCVTKDGQSTPTNNIPLGGFKLTGVGNATASTDAVNAGQIQSNALTYYADTGTADAYVITPAPVITAYAAGQSWDVKIANTSLTTTPTFNVNSLGAKTIKLPDGTSPAAGAYPVGAIVRFKYDGTNMQAASAAAGTGGTVTTSGTPASGNLTKFSSGTAITNGNLSGDISTTDTLVTTIGTLKVATGMIQANAVTLAKLATQAGNTVLAEATGSTAVPTAVSLTTQTVLGRLAANIVAVGVGTSANNLVQLDGSAKLPAVDGSALTNLPSSYVFLGSQTASTSASLAFTSKITSSYDLYVFVFKDIRPATTNQQLNMLTSVDNGSNYNATNNVFGFTSKIAMDGSASSYANAANGGTTFHVMGVNDINNGAADALRGEIKFFNPNSTIAGKSTEGIVFYNSSGTTVRCLISNSSTSTAAMNAVKFQFNSGNITSGTIYMYGVKNA